MSIQKGDRVTLSSAPTIQLAQYSYVKPSGSVTRDIVSSDPEGIEAELKEMQGDLRRVVCRALITELNLSSDLHEALADGTDGLAQFCYKEIGYGRLDQGQAQGVGVPAPGKGDPAGQEKPRAKPTAVRRAVPPARKQ